jgi:hypothetical protein
MIERPSQDGNKYWDDPVDRVEGGQIDPRFIEFFDWNQLAARDFQYYRVKINSFPKHPHLVGREALLEIRYAGVFLIVGSRPDPSFGVIKWRHGRIS